MKKKRDQRTHAASGTRNPDGVYKADIRHPDYGFPRLQVPHETGPIKRGCEVGRKGLREEVGYSYAPAST